MVELDGGWQQHLYLAEGRCNGVISGRFRGANAPLRQGAAGPFRPDIRAVIEADDGSTIMFDCLGRGARIRLHAGRSSVPSFTPATPSASDASTTRSVSASVRSGRRPIPHKRPIVSSMSPSSFGGRSTIDRRPRRPRCIEAEATADQIRSGPLVRMEGDSRAVTAALHGCGSEEGVAPAPPRARCSSAASVKSASSARSLALAKAGAWYRGARRSPS
jgi:hypothetical protein